MGLFNKKLLIIIVIGAIFLAPQALERDKGEREKVMPFVWLEGTRGWAENGTYLWTGVSPLPSYNVGIGTSTPSYKLDVVGNTRVQGSLYINSWPISVTSAPTVGYVLKWNGSAFVPQQDAGITQPEWYDAGEYLRPYDDASAFTQIYESATPTSGYRVAGAYNSSIYGLLGTQYSGVQGNSNNASGAGVVGVGTGTSGVYGESNVGASADAGVYGVNTNASGTGIIGMGSNVSSLAWSGQGDGIVGASDAYGVVGSHYNGSNNNRWGALGTQYWGVYGSSDNISGGGVGGFYTGTGDGIGVYGRSVPADWYGYGGYFVGGYMGVFGGVYPTGSYSYYGVRGVASGGTGTNVGVYGYASTSNRPFGVQGQASGSAYGAGTMGYHTHQRGTGAVGLGSGPTSFYTLVAGSGGAFTGDTFGVFGRATLSQNGCAGGYFDNGSAYAYVALTWGGNNYKINGNGTVATIMETREGRKNLFAPEAPEPFIFDFGEGRLVNGRAKITLDPLLQDCIEINGDNSFKVFIQLKEECNGVYVKTTRDGFEVVELRGGNSNASFDYMIVAKWKGYKGSRFPPAPPPQEEIVHKVEIEKDIKAEATKEIKREPLEVQQIQVQMKVLKEKLQELEQRLEKIKEK